MVKLYKHQQDIINDNREKTGIFLGCGTAKTLTAMHLVYGTCLVVAPKTTVEDNTWGKAWNMMDSKCLYPHVISKETFRRDAKKLPRYDTVIFDEVHTVAGLTPDTRRRKGNTIPKSSQLFEATMEYLKRTEPKRIYAVSATPTRSPMCVLGIAWMLGKTWDFYKFREAFYTQVRMGMRQIWMAKKDQATKDRLGKAVRTLGYTGRMSDYFDVPTQTFVVKQVPLTSAQEKMLKELPLEYPDPLVLVGKKHQVEQGVLAGTHFSESQVFPTGKLEAIEDLLEEYPKVLIFAKYTEQIHLIEKYIQKLKIPVYTLTGATKDRGDMLHKAENTPRCVVIAQTAISAGWELPSFRCTIYASQDYSFVNKEQSEWRTLRANNLDKNLYVYLLSGKVDNAVYNTLLNKQDFHEAQFAKVI